MPACRIGRSVESGSDLARGTGAGAAQTPRDLGAEVAKVKSSRRERQETPLREGFVCTDVGCMCPSADAVQGASLRGKTLEEERVRHECGLSIAGVPRVPASLPRTLVLRGMSNGLRVAAPGTRDTRDAPGTRDTRDAALCTGSRCGSKGLVRRGSSRSVRPEARSRRSHASRGSGHGPGHLSVDPRRTDRGSSTGFRGSERSARLSEYSETSRNPREALSWSRRHMRLAVVGLPGRR